MFLSILTIGILELAVVYVSGSGGRGFLPWKIGKYYKSGIFIFSRADLQAQC